MQGPVPSHPDPSLKSHHRQPNHLREADRVTAINVIRLSIRSICDTVRLQVGHRIKYPTVSECSIRIRAVKMKVTLAFNLTVGSRKTEDGKRSKHSVTGAGLSRDVPKISLQIQERVVAYDLYSDVR